MGCCGSSSRTRVKIATLTRSPSLTFQRVKPSDLIKTNKAKFTDLYKLGNRIGAGSFGEVRRCIHKITGALRAVKVYNKELFCEDSLEKLKYEMSILRCLDHPNAIKTYEFFEDVEHIYIVMEYCQGGELFDKITKLSHFDELEAANIMKQLFSVVSYLHSKRIVHRDLKPENIMLEERGKEIYIKLVDFGSAVFLDENSRTSGIHGTSFYMAPEVLNGGEYGEKCDMWSCGVILYILLSGKPPFHGKDDEDVYDKVKKGLYSTDIAEMSFVSAEAKDLIHKVLVPEDQRLVVSQALEHPWLVEKSAGTPIKTSFMFNVISNLKKFRSSKRLTDAIRTLIATHIINMKDAKEQRDVFIAMDRDGDGKLSKEDIKNQLLLSMSESEADEQVERIIQQVDSDKNGFIDFTEYIRASLDNSIIFSQENLFSAFSLLDQDKNGKVTVQDLMDFFAQSSQENIASWSKVLTEADADGDGELDLEDFKSFFLENIE